ncbi:MAG TPA: Ig-like domain-containing protein [Solirubrobacterales bacterium]|nr:Ig-like domain-containing protein [Solirubrobacterales bacterium]
MRLSIAPVDGTTDSRPDRGITVRAAGGRISRVVARAGGERISGKLNAAGTVWHSAWALGVSRRYTVTATAVGRSGDPVTRSSRFRTFTPSRTFSTQIIEGYKQTYGVGMPIILYFSRPVANRAAVERALEVKTSKPVVGAWHWDSRCNLAAVCLYFRPRRYWPAHTQVSFTAHLDGVEAAPGVYGDHTLTQRFEIGSRLTVVADTASHYMDVYREGKLFAHWPISSGKPGDETPNGTYLTIEKGNPVDMVGPGYDIEVPWSVRFTWSGDYLHDAYWSVGDQGFTNVSHGCINMSPADAETFYEMAVPGDPVTIIGSPRTGVWDNGWTMWFLSWKRWLRGSALGMAVRSGPGGSRFVSPSALGRRQATDQKSRRRGPGLEKGKSGN